MVTRTRDSIPERKGSRCSQDGRNHLFKPGLSRGGLHLTRPERAERGITAQSQTWGRRSPLRSNKFRLLRHSGRCPAETRPESKPVALYAWDAAGTVAFMSRLIPSWLNHI